MPNKFISRTMFYCWYFLLILIDSFQAQNPFDGGGFLADPFIELTAEATTAAANSKTNKSDSTCVTNGALAGSIIATLLLSALIAFLTWMVYLRQKLHELKTYENQGGKYYEQNHPFQPSLLKQMNSQPTYIGQKDQKENQLPLDVTDVKFGTFPFRQSQTPSLTGHSNANDWLNRIPSSFRSVTNDHDIQTMDIELLNPTFCGLNFSITGNMRAGIYVKDILDKETDQEQIKLNSSDQLRTGDRIIALTICFESIVYEDALTILSYASPYPVILRVQRPIHSTKFNTVTEKRSGSANKVKWRDDFEHYDNDTPYNRSVSQVNSSKTLITEVKSSTPSKTSSSNKGNKKSKPSSSSSSPPIQSKNKRLNPKKKLVEKKKPNPMILTSTGLSSKPIEKKPSLTKKLPKKSVTNAVMSYLHYRGVNGGYSTDAGNPAEGTVMPYYDSPYGYYGAHLNRNNNNNDTVDSECLTAVKSVYKIELSTTKSNRCERRLSSPAVILPVSSINKLNEKDIDTFV